jgi:hypothetical protein
MESAREAVRKVLENLLDAWADIAADLAHSPQRDAIDAKMLILEEKLLHWDAGNA